MGLKLHKFLPTQNLPQGLCGNIKSKRAFLVSNQAALSGERVFFASLMCRHLLFIAFLLCGQFAVGQDSVYGNYKGTGKLLDSLLVTYRLSLRQDGSYKMQSIMRDSSIVETGKWKKQGNNVKLKPKYSKAEKRYKHAKTFVLNIESDRLIWKPYKNKQELERETKKSEKEMSKTVGEKVTLVDKSEPLILYKEN